MLQAEHYLTIARAAFKSLYPASTPKDICGMIQGQIGAINAGGALGDAVDRIFDEVD